MNGENQSPDKVLMARKLPMTKKKPLEEDDDVSPSIVDSSEVRLTMCEVCLDQF